MGIEAIKRKFGAFSMGVLSRGMGCLLAGGMISAQVSSQAQDTDLHPQPIVPCNSSQPELIPRLSPDGQTLYFVRTERRDDAPQPRDQNIWVTQRTPQGGWGPARPLRTLNTSGNDGVCSVLPGGRTLLLNGYYLPDGRRVMGLSMTHRLEDSPGEQWSRPENLPIDGFTPRSPWVNFFLANDGRTMLLELEGPDSYGRQDLYVSFRQPHGRWSRPHNLGADLNTPDFEFAPYLAADMRTLYFASSGHGGYGNVDLWMSRRLDDSWQHWSAPVNLGPEINTPGFEAYLTLAASGSQACYSTDRNLDGNSELMEVQLPEMYQPGPVVYLAGEVLKAGTGAPIGAEIRCYQLPDTNLRCVARTDPATGRYDLTLPAGESWLIEAHHPQWAGPRQPLHLGRIRRYYSLKRNFRLNPLVDDSTLYLARLQFEPGKAQLTPAVEHKLDEVSRLLEEHHLLHLQIGNLTTLSEEDPVRRSLLRKRARRVRTWLRNAGVARERIK